MSDLMTTLQTSTPVGLDAGGSTPERNSSGEGTVNPEEMCGSERDRARARMERKQKAQATRALPTDDPSQWVGRKVRNKRTGATYVIRQVYKSNRVELEKSWMTYSADVPAIRSDYEICI